MLIVEVHIKYCYIRMVNFVGNFTTVIPYLKKKNLLNDKKQQKGKKRNNNLLVDLTCVVHILRSQPPRYIKG